MISEDSGRSLPEIARARLEEALLGTPPMPVRAGAELAAHGACFVTLTLDGQLRGCVGTLRPYRALLEDVRDNALAAAFRDSRFPALTEGELPRLGIEVSVLSAAEELPAAGEDELLAALRPGVDGLVLTCGERQSTYLPAVWKSLPRAADFVAKLKAKAGLPEDFWSPDLVFRRYTVKSWHD